MELLTNEKENMKVEDYIFDKVKKFKYLRRDKILNWEDWKIVTVITKPLTGLWSKKKNIYIYETTKSEFVNK